MPKKNEKGFAFFELLIALTILAIIFTILSYGFFSFQKHALVDTTSQEIANYIRSSQTNTTASRLESQYGVYFNNAPSPNQYVIFKGASYGSRDASYDRIFTLPSSLEFYDIDFNGGNEIVFARLTGNTQQAGSVSLRVKNEPARNKTIYVDGSGNVEFEALESAPEPLTSDSRHVHIDYTRILAETETITLTFNGAVQENLLISENLAGGEFFWEGEVEADGHTEKIKIHTHRLNGTDTQFCIHRSRDENTKSFAVSASADGTGNIIQYTADGANVSFSSIYAQNLDLQ